MENKSIGKRRGEMMRNDNESKNKAPVTESNCFCCGQISVELWDICEVCGWQNQMTHNEAPDLSGGANILSLNQYKEQWLAHHQSDLTPKS